MTEPELFDFRQSSQDTDKLDDLTRSLRIALNRSGNLFESSIRRPVSISLDSLELGQSEPQDGEVLLAAESGGRSMDWSVRIREVDIVSLASVLMGGTGEETREEPTGFERTLVADRLATVLRPMWNELGIGPTQGIEVQLVPSKDQVSSKRSLVLQATVTTADRPLTLVVTGPMAAGAASGPPGGEAALADVVGEVPVELRMSFAPIPIRAADLEDITAGDVIRLHDLGEANVYGEVDGRTLLRARQSNVGDRAAVEVIEILGELIP